MRALVLGATGHIGAHIVRALLAEGHSVRAAYRSERFLGALDGLALERVHVDLDTFDGLRQALEGCEWVFHAAGYYPRLGAKREKALQIGITTTSRLNEEFLKAKPSRIVFTSSAATIRHIIGRSSNETDAESWPTKEKLSLYATVKIAMENESLLAQKRGLPVVIVNPSYCIGEYDARTFSGLLLLLFAKHRLPFYLDYRLNVVYTADVGVAHVKAAEQGAIGERYILANRNMTLGEFASLVAKEMKIAPPRWRISYGSALAFAFALECASFVARTEPLLTRQSIRLARRGQVLDNSKAVRKLCMPQTPIEEAVRRAIGWFRANGHLP